LEILREGGCEIEYFTPELSDHSCRTHLHFWLDGRYLLFDISDYQATVDDRLAASADAVFKLHYSRSLHGRYPNLFPFSPVSFYDWSEYRRLAREIVYRADGMVLSNQRPHTQNLERRTYVQDLLRARFGDEFDNSFTEQREFWRKVKRALVSVCVPGSRIDILDRGQLQYLAFGACTVSPRLSIDLPYGHHLIPNVHYLECQTEWCDLVERIEWARSHRTECLEIGRNARKLFENTLTARALFEWVSQCLLGE
jgi:hypothetical protein